MMEELNYEKDVKIDLNRLHIEWITHPAKYQRYTEAKSQLIKEEKQAKNKLELVKAKLNREIRQKPEKFAIDPSTRLTEPLIESTIILDDKYQEAYSALIEAEYKVNVIDGAVKSMWSKRDGLIEERHLWISGYYSTPKFPKGRDFEEYIENAAGDTTVTNRRALRTAAIKAAENTGGTKKGRGK